jgi:hypothetical protein
MANCLVAYLATLSCSPDLVIFVTRKFREAKETVPFWFGNRLIYLRHRGDLEYAKPFYMGDNFPMSSSAG